MSVVIIAFATVFPSGYRLNFSNLNQSKAAGFATGVAEQIANLSPLQLRGYETGANVAPALVTARLITLPPNLSGTQPTLSNAFWLKSVTVVRQATPPPFPDSTTSSLVTADGGGNTAICADEVVVTVSWSETRRNLPNIVKTVSVTTLTNNVLGR